MSAKKLLIVDDSGFARKLLRRILEEGGFEVEEAGEEADALAKYQIDKPNAVFLDIVMSGMGGLEVLRKIREADSEAVVIMASADIQEGTRRAALAAGAADFVNKPFKPQEVLAAARRATGDAPS